MKLRNRAISFVVTAAMVWNNAMAPISLAYGRTDMLYEGLSEDQRYLMRASAEESEQEEMAVEPDADGNSEQGEQQDQSATATLEQKLSSVDGKVYAVRLTADATGLPEGAALRVTEVVRQPTEDEVQKNPDAYKDRPGDTEVWASEDEMAGRSQALARALGTKDGDQVIWAKYLRLSIMGADGAEYQLPSSSRVEVETNAVAPERAAALEVALVDGDPTTPADVERSSRIDTYVDGRGDVRERTWSKVSGTVDRVGELALAVVATPVRTWELHGGTADLLAPRYGVTTEASEADARAPEGSTLVPEIAFRAQTQLADGVVDPSSGRGIQLWVRVRPAKTEDVSGALFAWREVDDGAMGQLDTSKSPAAIRADETIDLLWDPAYADVTLEVGDVTLRGALPEGAEADVAERTGDFGDPAALAGDAAQVADDERLATVAAYDLGVTVDGGTYEPDADHPVEATVAGEAVAAAQAADLEVWRVGEGGEASAVNAKATGEAVSFDATEPGTYLVVERTTVTSRVVASDGTTYTITATYGPDAGLPRDAKMRVTEVKGDAASEYQRQAAEAINARQPLYFRAFDVSFVDGEGNEVEPAGKVDVTVELADAEARGDASVVHFADGAERPEVIKPQAEAADRGAAFSFEAESFSVYAVAYTVDFHWGAYTFNLPGGSTIYLSELLETLINGASEEANKEPESKNGADGTAEAGTSAEGTENRSLTGGSAGAYDTAQLQKILEHPELVEKVAFSDPELVRIQKMDILDDQKLIEDDDSEELVETTHTDWLLMSQAPFNTEETLTITLKDGEKIDIPVTDIVYGDDSGETVTKGAGRHVIADGVTYLLSNTGNANGTARVTSLTPNATIHDTIVYNGHRYVTENVREAEGTLTHNTNVMDWDVIHKIATYGFDLPTIVQEPDDPTGGDTSYKSGTNNDGDNKVWKKAELNGDTITYTLKYFQAMKKDVPLDFIFVYDDSASMYSGNRTSGGITLCEAQTTRVLILAATKALFSKGDAEGYDINVYLSGASTGHTTYSGPFSTYATVEGELATYRTGTTRHAIGVRNAMDVARRSKIGGRNPVVIYLSDFHQPGTLGTGGINDAATLHFLAPVYALGTDTGYRFTTNNATRNIPTDASHYRTMNDIGGGVRELEDIILDAIGYYIKGNVAVTDNLSEALKNRSTTSATASGNGTVNAQTGKTDWSVGNQNPLLKAGQVYTETFTVQLDPNKVYSGSTPTNTDVSVKVGNTETNSIPASESPKLGSGVGFVLGKMNKDGSYSDVKLNGVGFTLQKQGESTVKTYTTDTNGAFTVPFADYTFVPGEKYTLTQDQTTTAALTGDKEVTIANPMTWTLTVNSDYTIKAEKAGADTDVTISNGKFNLWNREFTNPPLTKIYVQKIWDEGVPNDLKQPITFTVYGKNGDQKIALPAYAHEDDGSSSARKANTQVTQLTSSDTDKDNTPYTKAIWVPEYAVTDSENIVFKNGDTYNYTIGEAALAAPKDDTTDGIIGVPGEWADGVSGYIAGTPTAGAITWPRYDAHTTNTTIYFYVKNTLSYDYSNVVKIGFSYHYGGELYRTGVKISKTTIQKNKDYYIKMNLDFPLNQLTDITPWTSQNNDDTTVTNRNFEYQLQYSKPSGTQISNISEIYTLKRTVVPGESGAATLTLTNTFNQYNLLTLNSTFTDATRDSAATKNEIKYVGYSVTNSAGAVVATPEAAVTTTSGNTKSADVKFYVPTGDTYTAKQAYYKLSDGTIVNADDDGKFNAFTVTPSISDAPAGAINSVNGSTASVDDNGGTITFTNNRKQFPVVVKATWDPVLGTSAKDQEVKTNGIPYEIKWGEGTAQKLNGAVKEADNDPWTKKYTDVPNYTIKGEETNCSINATTDPHPNYETAVNRAQSGDNVLFEIVNTIKKGEITIAKDWEIDGSIGSLRPESVTVHVKNAAGTVMSFPITTVDEEGNVTTSDETDLVLSESNGWKLRVQADVGQNYTVEEVPNTSDDYANLDFNAAYKVTTFDNAGNPSTADAVTGSAQITDLGLDGAIVDITNDFKPIARVSNDNGTNWKYFEALLTENAGQANEEEGAFNYANTLTGDVIIETLCRGIADGEDDTNGRYTLTSGFVFNNTAIKSLTMRTMPELGFASVLTKSQSTAPMIKVTQANDSQIDIDLRVEGLVFDGNNTTGDLNGGLFNLRTKSAAFTDCVFKDITVKGNTGSSGGNSSTRSDGGAVFYNYNSAGTLKIQGCQFANIHNTTGNGSGRALGGAVYYTSNTKGQLIIDESPATGVRTSFDNCSANRYGGAFIAQYDCGKVSVKHADFNKCSANLADGGAIDLETADCELEDCTFVDCHANAGVGGAIRFDKAAATAKPELVTNCTFVNCSAKNGGAISSRGALEISNSGINGVSFDVCSATDSGGAVYSGGALQITDALFESCTAINNGGAVFADGATVLTNTSFGDKNDASKACGKTGTASGKEGGAVRVNGSLTFNNTTDDEIGFYYSQCPNSAGGAIYVSKGGMVMNNTGGGTIAFEHCKCPNNNSGGAIYVYSGDFKAENNNGTIHFLDCSTEGGSYGAGALGTERGRIILDNNSGTFDFADCYALSTTGSGAIYTSGALSAENNSGSITFARCVAPNGSGGAIHAGGDISIVNTSTGVAGFTDCSAASGGAIVGRRDITLEAQADGELIRFENCKATGTSNAGGGAIRHENGTMQLTNAIFGEKGNQDKTCSSSCYGGAIYGAGNGKMIYTNTTNKEIGFFYTPDEVSSASTGGTIYATGRYSVELSNTQAGGTIAFDHSHIGSASGGAVYLDGGTFSVNDNKGTVYFNDCSTTGGSYAGGAVCARGGFNSTDNSGTVRFTNCVAGAYNGGALNTGGTGVTVENNTGSFVFENCSAPGYGGAIYTTGTNCVISGTGTIRFEDCTSNGTNGAGGVIFHGGDGAHETFELDNASFVRSIGKNTTNNDNNKGAVIFTAALDATLKGCTIYAGESENDTAAGAKFGGAVCQDKKNDSATSISLIDTRIYGFQSTVNNSQGGGVWSDAQAMYLQDSVISHCKVKSMGGGIYSLAKTVGIHNTLTVTDNAIDNTTVTNAGGIYFQPEDTVITVTSDTDEAYILIYDNTMSNGKESNLHMGIGAPGIEVKGIKTGGLTGKVGVVNPAVMDRWFGRSTAYRVCGEPTEDHAPHGMGVEMFQDDTKHYFAKYQGILQRRLIWAPLPNDGICKITDENGNLLYYDFGEGRQEAVFGSLADAFGAYAEWADDPATFTRIDGITAVKPANIEMLVTSYTQAMILFVPNGTESETLPLTLKTAAQTAPDGLRPGPGSVCTITRGNFGGSMYVMDGKDIFTVTGITLDGGNKTDAVYNQNGGIIRSDGAECQLNLLKGDTDNGGFDCTLQNSKTTGHHGGAVYMENGGSFHMDGAIIKTCRAEGSGSGGAVYLAGANHPVAKIENSRIADCYAGANGGFIYSNAENLEINTSKFVWNTPTSNMTGYHGGMVYVSNTCQNLTVSDTHFTNFRAGSNGGAIYSDATGTVSVSGCTFGRTQDNYRAAANGGAIFMNRSGSELNVTNSTFTRLRAGSNGGAIYANGGVTVNLTGEGQDVAMFDHCFQADNSDSYRGGALFAAGTVMLKNLQIKDCHAGYSVSNDDFSGLTYYTGKGGGIALAATAMATLDNVSITECGAYMGGAIYTENTTPNALVLKNGTQITGNKLHPNAGTRIHAAGVYMTNGGTITLGSSDIPSDSVAIKDNETATGESSNLRLSSESTATDADNEDNSMLVLSALTGEIHVVNPGSDGDRFGTKDASISEDVAEQIFSDVVNHFTEKGRTDNELHWQAGEPVWKITDAAGNTLQYNGKDAVFVTLKSAYTAFQSISGAVNIELFRPSFTVKGYEGQGVYMMETGIAYPNKSMDVTLKTASATAPDGKYAYIPEHEGDAWKRASILRGNTDRAASMFNLSNANNRLTLTDIVLDGQWDKSQFTSAKGGAVYLANVKASLTMLDNSAINHARSTDYGGGVYVGGANANLYITPTAGNEARIEGCQGTYGGGIYSNRAFALDGNVGSVIVKDCTADGGEGGGLYINGAGSMNNNAGLIHFDGCYANGGYGGGGIKSTGAFTANDNTGEIKFTGCHVSGDNKDGGGIYPHSFTMENNQGDLLFDGCYTNGYDAEGGAILSYTSVKLVNAGDGTATFNNCCTNGGKSEGGAIFAYTSTPTVTLEGTADNPITFTSCHATGGGGGAIWQHSNASMTLTNIVFGAPQLDEEGNVLRDEDGNALVDESKRCYSAGDGGAVRAAGALTYANTTGGEIGFYGSTSTGGAGGGMRGDSSVTLVNQDANCSIVFLSCESKGTGGGLSAGGAFGLDDFKGSLVFNKCYANNGHGGGAYAGGAFTANGNTGDISFTGCHTSGGNCDGGGIYPHSFTMENNQGDLLFDGCYTNGYDAEGGAILSYTSVKLVNAGDGTATFNNCCTNGGNSEGGAIFAYTSTPTVILEGTADNPITFTSCHATGDGGGAIWQHNNAAMTLTNVTFGEKDDDSLRCYATGAGGSVYVKGPFTYTNSSGKELGFFGSEARGGAGGAIRSESTVTLINQGDASKTSFENCSAKGDGGAIYAAAALSMDDNPGTFVFDTCETFNSENEGGAIYANGNFSAKGNAGLILFDTCRTGANTTSTLSSEGGAVFYTKDFLLQNVGDGQACFVDCSGNAKDGGGAICGWDDTNNKLSIEGTQAHPVEFTRCTNTCGKGGAIYVNKGIFDKLEYVSFTDCSARKSDGGAVYLKRGNTISHLLFDGNEAKSYGGALYVAGNLTIEDTVIQNGEAQKGSAIYVANNVTLQLNGGWATGDNAKAGVSIGRNTATATDRKGGAINVGGSGAKLIFDGNVVVFNNKCSTDTTGKQHNVVLDVNSSNGSRSTAPPSVIQTTDKGIGEAALIGVYATDTYPYNYHGKEEENFGWFGTKNSSAISDLSVFDNLDKFVNDRQNLTGTINLENTRPYLCWSVGFVCKLTDADGNILYRDALAHTPAVFKSLKLGMEWACAPASRHTLYTSEKTAYDWTQDIQLKLLTDVTLGGSERAVFKDAARKLTITTAGIVESQEDGYPYAPYDGDATVREAYTAARGGDTVHAVILRNSNLSGSMFDISNTRTYTVEDQAAYDEDVKDEEGNPVLDENGNQTIIHHPAVTHNESATGELIVSGLIFDGKIGDTQSTYSGDGSAFIVRAADKVTIRDAVFANLTASKGGAIRFTSSTELKTEGNVTFKNCTATSSGGAGEPGGGAINAHANLNMDNSGVLTFDNCAAAGGQGGAVNIYGVAQDYSSTITIKNSGTMTFKDCSSAADAGALGVQENHLTFDNSGSISFTDCTVTGQEGGAINIDSGLLTVKNTADAELNFTRCKATASDGYGGAINAGSMDASENNGKISFTGCEAKKEGGAVRLNNGNLTVTAKVENGLKIDGCISETNGGAIYAAGNTDISGTADHAVIITGCEASGKGGAVYVPSGKSLTLNGGTSGTGIRITGNRSTNGGAIDARNSSSRLYFAGNVEVYDNLSGSDQKNVVLGQNSNLVINTTAGGLGEDALIGIYVTGNDSTNPYKDHGRYEQDFGTYDSTKDSGKANLNGFTNDRNGLYGEVDPNNDTLIRWQSYLCKLTDADGNLLYTTEKVSRAGAKRVTVNNAAAVVYPAVYRYLKTQSDATKVGGFNAARGTLYTASGAAVANNAAVQVQMLRNYTQPDTDQPTVSGSRAVTFTTANNDASQNPVTGDVYIYNQGSDATKEAERATITRASEATAGSMLTVNGASTSLTTTGLIFDGNMVTTNANGGIVKVRNGSLNVNAGTTIRKSIAQNGGAVYLEAGSIVAIGGTTDTTRVLFEDCRATENGGVIYDGHSGNTDIDTVKLRYVTIDGHAGSLANTTPNAELGGAIYITKSSGLKIGGSVRLKDCTILDCSASDQGGAVFSESLRRIPAKDENSGDEPTVHMLHTVIDGHDTLPNTVMNAPRGGAILLANGTLELESDEFGKSEIRNCTADTGGAIESYGGGTQYKGTELAGQTGDYTVKIKNTKITNCTATEEGGAIKIKAILTMIGDEITGCSGKNGGAVYMRNDVNSVLNMDSGTISGNNAFSGNGGAVYLETNAVMNLTGGTISGNTVPSGKNGAGIYLVEGSKLNISGSPSFSGTEPTDVNRIGAGTDARREDIYIAGYLGLDGEDPKLAESLVVTGKLYDSLTTEQAKGRIWVGAEVADDSAQDENKDNNHWDTLKQFARFADALMAGTGDNTKIDESKLSEADVEKIYAAFRNATLSDEAYGMTGDGQTGGIQCIYWEGAKGTRRVILRKVSTTYESLSGAKFTITKGSKPISGTDIHGTPDATVFESGDNGVFYIGMLDYGVYILHETVVPNGYDANKPYYYLIVDEDGTVMSDPTPGYDSAAAAKTDGDALFKQRQTDRQNAA